MTTPDTHEHATEARQAVDTQSTEAELLEPRLRAAEHRLKEVSAVLTAYTKALAAPRLHKHGLLDTYELACCPIEVCSVSEWVKYL
jgi:hypothetical protein